MVKPTRCLAPRRAKSAPLRSRASLSAFWLSFLTLTVVSCAADESARIVFTQTGQPLANALVILTQLKQPFFAGLFADGTQCEKIAFSRTDVDGRVVPVTGLLMRGLRMTHAVADDVRDIKPMEVELINGRYVLRATEMTGLTDAEQIGAQYATREAADAALVQFLATPVGTDYTGFTLQRAGEGHTNWRHLRAKRIELARFAPTFSTEAEAEQVRQSTRFATSGAPDVDAMLATVVRCNAARLGESAAGIEVLRKMEAYLPPSRRTAEQARTLADFAARLDERLRSQ